MNQFRTNGITAVGTISQLREFCKSVKKKLYDLRPYKSPFRLPTAFKFDPVKFSSVGFQIPALE
jgi:hypothetical protein